MKRSTPSASRFVPEVTPIELRLLLAVAVTCIGQDGHDLVGPDASQGSDGIQDLHLQLSGLAAAVSQIVVTAPGGFRWATEPDPTGAALAEYFPSSSPGQSDLYLNPEVKSDLAAPGATLPLGGSTGSLIETVERRSPQRHNQLPGTVGPGHGQRGRIKPDLGHRSDAHDQYTGECEFVVPGRERGAGWERAVL